MNCKFIYKLFRFLGHPYQRVTYLHTRTFPNSRALSFDHVSDVLLQER